MKLSFITPLAFLDTYASQSSAHLALAHISKENQSYRRFFRRMGRRGETVILDNSAYELGDDTFTAQELHEIASRISAKYIMAPEATHDSGSTIDRFLEFRRSLPPDAYARVFVTVHGQTMEDVLWCARTAIFHGAAAIGISCRTDVPICSPYTPLHGNDSIRRSLVRVEIVKRIVDELLDDIISNEVYIHLLGLNHPLELSFYNGVDELSVVSSCDSSAAYMFSRLGASVSDPTIVKPSESIDFDESFSDFGPGDRLQMVLVYLQSNIHRMKLMAGDVEEVDDVRESKLLY